MSDLISVIIPIYGVEAYLDRCIKSVLNQTYSNLEIILVDDGSKDLCPKMCDSYALHDSRIKVLHKENGGLASARNAGLDTATGKYISFVDSDDYISLNFIEKMYTSIKKENADLCICGIEPIYEENCKRKIDILGYKAGVISQMEMYKRLSQWYYVTVWNKLYKREIFNGIRFPNGKIHEDEYIGHYVVKKCEKIVIIEDELYKYVQRNNSIMNSDLSVKHLDLIYALMDRYFFFKKEKISNCACSTLIAAYGHCISFIEKMNLYQNEKEIKNCINVIYIELKKNKNIRAIKLKLILYKYHLI